MLYEYRFMFSNIVLRYSKCVNELYSSRKTNFTINHYFFLLQIRYFTAFQRIVLMVFICTCV